jgi:hypothetical protein
VDVDAAVIGLNWAIINAPGRQSLMANDELSPREARDS